MGSDDLFKKRKAANLERQKVSRAQRKRILIVTEDEKSALLYLRAFWRSVHRGKDRLLAESVTMVAGQGSSPDCVVKTAKKAANKAYKAGDSYNDVYCVMDVDQHEHLNDALQVIRNGPKPAGTKYHAIVSNPCFEYWVLLHYKESSKPFSSKRVGKSSCDCVREEFKKIDSLKGYDKGDVCTLQTLAQNKTGLNAAIERAQRILGGAAPEGINPSTNFYELIKDLTKLQTEYSTT